MYMFLEVMNCLPEYNREHSSVRSEEGERRRVLVVGRVKGGKCVCLVERTVL